MDDSKSLSPKKKQTTYAGRAKRNRRTYKDIKMVDGSSSSDEEAKTVSAAMPPPSSPAQKRFRAQSDLPPLHTTPKPMKSTSQPNSATKNTPAVSPLQHLQSPDAGDETESIAESTVSKHQHRSEEDRLAWFRVQPDCREVEPHRAFCVHCKEWIVLNPHLKYTMRPWMRHRKACRKGTNQKPSSVASTSRLAARDRGSSDAEESASAIVSITEKPVRRNEAERQAVLEQDPRAEEVRPYEVLCKTCSKWIQLGNRRRFNLNPWKMHQKRCSGQIPSKHVANVQRKIALVNDKTAKSFTDQSVDCAHCGATVSLSLQGDTYGLAEWEAHKAACSSTTINCSNGEVGESDVTRDMGEAAEAAQRNEPDEPLGPSRGTKRAREDDSADDRPVLRRRTSSHQSGFINWILTPLRSFVAGFKAGINQAEDQI